MSKVKSIVEQFNKKEEAAPTAAAPAATAPRAAVSEKVKQLQTVYDAKAPSAADTKTSTTLAENEIKVTAKGGQRSYITYAIALLNGEDGKTKYDTIKVSGMGVAIYNAVNIAEIVKRRVKGVHQITEISSQVVHDSYEAVDAEKAGEKKVDVERKVSTILITLSTKPLDKKHVGYQAPLSDDQVTEQEDRPRPARRERRPAAPAAGEGAAATAAAPAAEGEARGRGRGGRGSGRGSRGRGGRGSGRGGRGTGEGRGRGGRGSGEGRGRGTGEGRGRGTGEGRGRGRGGADRREDRTVDTGARGGRGGRGKN